MRLARPLLGILTFASLVLGLSTCELSKVLSTPKLRKVVLSFEGDSTLIMGSGIKPALRVTIDGDAVIDPEVRFASSDTTIIAVGANGDSLLARKLGRATITASLEGTLLPEPLPSALDTIYVVPKTFTLDRSSATLTALGETVQLQANATDALDRAIPNLGIVWSSSDTSRAIVSPTGLVTARANSSAPVKVSARLDGIAATADITIAQRLARFVFQPSTIAFDALGAQASVAVTGQDRNGNLMPVSASMVWSSGNSSVASVHPTNGTIISVDNGSTFVRASVAEGDLTISDTVHVDVNQQATRISITSLSGLAIPAIGGKVQLTARAFDRLDAEMKKPVSWTSLDGDIAGVDANGLVTGRALGNARIQARVDGATTLTTIVVQNLAASVSVSPKTASITSVGDALQLTATVSNALGATIPGAAIAWSTPDGAIASLSSTGVLTTTGVGTARAIASSGGKADTSIVTITNSPDQVDIILADATLASANDSLIPAVTVTNARGVPLTASSLLWTTDDAAVARVTATGTIIAAGSGATFIKAVSPTNSTRRDSILITVTNAPASLLLSDTRDTLTAIGRSRTYTATVRNARGARLADATVTWQSTVPSVASVSEGTSTAEGIGSTLIIARSGAVGDTIELSVTNDPISIDLQPPTLAIASVDDTVRLSVTLRNDLGNVNSSSPVVWSSTVPSVATVDASGSVASHAIGTARIIAMAGALADTTVVTVTNNPATIAIAPDTVRLTSLGDSIAPAATLTNSRGVALPRTAATWSADDPTIARVSAAGMITARDTGTTIVRATNGSVTDAVVVVATNAPAAVVLSATKDTLTAVGQSISYTVSVSNLAGHAIDNPSVTWTSTNTAVATISGSGSAAAVTATGFGSTLLIARSGLVADTIEIAVLNPTRLYVDNSVFASPRTGSSTRPYAKIQDAVNAADPFDTVIVRKGNAAYSETVALAKRIVLLGDSTSFSHSSPNPSVLPLISHDTGSAAITAITTSTEVIRFFRIRHTVDGLAVDARGSDIRIAHLFVNTDETSVAGSGISVDNATNGRPALIDSVSVNAVVGFGIRLNGVVNGTVRGARITLVDSMTTFSGAGVEVTGGQNNLVELSSVRRTGGAQVLGSATATLTVRQNDLAGRDQLVRLVGVTGSSVISNNTFNLRLQSGEVSSGGSADDGRSGLEIRTSSNVSVLGNSFSDDFRLMDAVHVVSSRGAGPNQGARLQANQFATSRYAVRSSASTFIVEQSKSDGALRTILSEGTDTISISRDTLRNAIGGCVEATGGSTSISVYGALLDNCASASLGFMSPAVAVSGTSASLQVDSSTFIGASQTAVLHGAGTGSLSVTRNTIAPGGVRTVPLGATTAIIDARAAGTATVHRNVITGFTGLTAIGLAAGVNADVDSNLVARNGVALRVPVGATLASVENDWYENDTAAVVTQTPLSIPNNFWGDSAGPRRATKLRAAGDSAVGTITFDAVAPAPLYPGTGSASAMRLIWGAEQATGTVPRTAPLAKPFIVRVVDSQGRPLAGVTVHFAITTTVNPPSKWVESNVLTLDIVTGAGGLARGTFDPNNKAGTHTITITIPASPGLGSITLQITSG